MFFDIITIIVIIMTLWMYLIDLIMGNDDLYSIYGWKWLLFNTMIFLVFFLDIFLKFITGYFEKAVIITDKM